VSAALKQGDGRSPQMKAAVKTPAKVPLKVLTIDDAFLGGFRLWEGAGK